MIQHLMYRISVAAANIEFLVSQSVKTSLELGEPITHPVLAFQNDFTVVEGHTHRCRHEGRAGGDIFVVEGGQYSAELVSGL